MKKNSLVIIIGILFFVAAAGFAYAAVQPNPAGIGEECGQGIGADSCDEFFSGEYPCVNNCVSYNCADYGGISGVGCYNYDSYFLMTFSQIFGTFYN